MTKDHKGSVSIRPSEFKDTVEVYLLDNMELEKKRTKNFPQDNPLIRIHFPWLYPAVDAGVRGLAKGRTTKDIVSQTIVKFGIGMAEAIDDLSRINESTKHLTDVYNEYGGSELIDITLTVSRQCSPFRDYAVPSDKLAMAEESGRRLASLTTGTGLARYEIASLVYLLALSTAGSPVLFGVAKDADERVAVYMKYLSRRLMIIDTYVRITEDIIEKGAI